MEEYSIDDRAMTIADATVDMDQTIYSLELKKKKNHNNNTSRRERVNKKETGTNCSMYFRVVVPHLPTTYSAQEVAKCVGGGGQLFSGGWMGFY